MYHLQPADVTAAPDNTDPVNRRQPHIRSGGQALNI